MSNDVPMSRMNPAARDAHISPCGTFRWSLSRDWSDARRMLIVMLNPSTADGEKDDATIRRCVSFALREGCGGFTAVNLIPWRETSPTVLWRRIACASTAERRDAEERNATAWHQAAGATAGPILCAWGADALARSYAREFSYRIAGYDRPLACLGTTKAGAPRHPLYVRGDAPLVPWSPA